MTSIIRTPPMREKLAELAQRVEDASGPDRELDALVWAFTVSGYIEGRSVWYDDKGWVKHAVSLGDGVVRERKRLGDTTSAPAYTASLDAAMTLIDANTFFHLSRFDAQADGRSEAHVYPNRYVGDDYEAEAPTPALALCAAALRACAQAGAAQ